MHPDPKQRLTADGVCELQRVASIGSAGHERDNYILSQARDWRAAEAAAMDHPTNGLRTPTGDMSTRYVYQHTG